LVGYAVAVVLLCAFSIVLLRVAGAAPADRGSPPSAEVARLPDPLVGDRGLHAVEATPPPDLGRSVAACGECHERAVQQWRRSRHAVASRNPTFVAAWERWPNGWCVNCHAPLAEGQRQALGGLARPGAFVAPPVTDGSSLWDEGVTCAACHLREGELLTAREPTAAAEAAHDLVVEPALAGAAACVGCHEFPLQLHSPPAGGFSLGTTPAQATASEWMTSTAAVSSAAVSSAAVSSAAVSSAAVSSAAVSSAAVSSAAVSSAAAPAAAPEGEVCQDCHMGRNGHSFPGAHSPDLVRDLLEVSVAREGTAVALTVAAPGAAHRVPTGDPFRRLRAELCADTACAEVLASAELRRVLAPTDTTWEIVADRTLPPQTDDEIPTATLRLDATGATWWRLSYRFADPRTEDALPAAEIGYVIEEGPLPPPEASPHSGASPLTGALSPSPRN